ncbi:MAG TPA: M24 family metallopeptidase, partial [Candidatus Paceibacterota bacterium]
MIKLKTKEEINILREGGRRHAEIMQSLVNMVRPGLSTKELNIAVEKMIKEKGDEASILNFQPYGASRPYPASVCISVNDEVVHGIPTENPLILNEGDIVS